MNRVCLFLILFFLSPWTILEAQWEFEDPGYEDSLEVYEDMFGLEEPLNLTLKFNIKTFRRTRTQEKYHTTEMICMVNDSFRVTNSVRVKARGINRRDNCTMPPFWLNIRYSGIETEELDGIRRMKVVTRCRESKQYLDYVLREFLVYKIYNLVTPYSFRVRLINMKYVDTGKDNRESQCWGFLIEPGDMMARRLHGRLVNSDVLSMRTVDREVMDRLAMFQYMIGNGDYSVTGRHNLKIMALEPPGPTSFLPVPYDFDFTGLVNAQYAVPGEALGISSVRERYFLGPCRNESSYLKAIQELELVRDEIEALIWSFDYLDEESRFDMIGYIESFFNTAGNERFIERNISTSCR
jgi:hypothetical protein